MKQGLLLVFAFVSGASFAVPIEDKIVGEPPIEMIWAKRTQDIRPPTMDFEDLSGWTAEAVNAEVTLSQTREQQLFGRYVGKIATGVVGENASMSLRPPGYFFDPEIYYPTNPDFPGPTRTEIQFALDRSAK